jgi:hypothetical protein
MAVIRETYQRAAFELGSTHHLCRLRKFALQEPFKTRLFGSTPGPSLASVSQLSQLNHCIIGS